MAGLIGPERRLGEPGFCRVAHERRPAWSGSSLGERLRAHGCATALWGLRRCASSPARRINVVAAVMLARTSLLQDKASLTSRACDCLSSRSREFRAGCTCSGPNQQNTRESIMAVAYINRIGTAVPDHDVHSTFIEFVDELLPDRRAKLLFRRMAQRAEIEHRYSYFAPGETLSIAADKEGFYGRGLFPGTAVRMARFERDAHDLAIRAVAALGIDEVRDEITHLVVASCTGFTAPGLDQQLVQALGLDPGVEPHARRVHGLRGRGQRAQGGPPHRALGARGQGARGQSRALHLAHAGDLRSRGDPERAPLW